MKNLFHIFVATIALAVASCQTLPGTLETASGDQITLFDPKGATQETYSIRPGSLKWDQTTNRVEFVDAATGQRIVRHASWEVAR